ncbi:hypothetical protein AVEN_142621-1 [Araneus ventricosus]|uniref:Uncharacterized protein n=1 Tax=Araneus ventricosus TaxID=182803 RepID=A0A4Y2G9V5_ARAVE|nr:hypothetical protein AVEN_142621-1 [Araneus ventricosus]
MDMDRTPPNAPCSCNHYYCCIVGWRDRRDRTPPPPLVPSANHYSSLSHSDGHRTDRRDTMPHHAPCCSCNHYGAQLDVGTGRTERGPMSLCL